MDYDGADVELLVAEGLCGGADVVLAQTDLQNVADRPDEGKAENGWLVISKQRLGCWVVIYGPFSFVHPSFFESAEESYKLVLYISFSI